MNDHMTVMVRENMAARRFVRSANHNCEVCAVGEGRFIAVHERVLHHRREGAQARRMEHRDSMVCCGKCGATLVHACKAAGLDVFGSLSFNRASGVPLCAPDEACLHDRRRAVAVEREAVPRERGARAMPALPVLHLRQGSHQRRRGVGAHRRRQLALHPPQRTAAGRRGGVPHRPKLPQEVPGAARAGLHPVEVDT